MSNRMRLAAAVALLLITVGYAYYFMSRSRTVDLPPPGSVEMHTVTVEAMPDGSVKIGNERFSDIESLKAKVAEVEKAQPDAAFTLRTDQGASLENTSKAALLLQRSGAKHVWVITKPRSAPNGTAPQ